MASYNAASIALVMILAITSIDAMKPSTTDVDCVNSWSTCTAACEPAADRTETVTTAQSGTGEACSGTVDCEPGVDSCPASAPQTTNLTGIASMSFAKSPPDYAFDATSMVLSTHRYAPGMTNPFWQMDLERNMSVHTIEFWNRPDECADRMFLGLEGGVVDGVLVSGAGGTVGTPSFEDQTCQTEYPTHTFNGDSQGATFGVSDSPCVSGLDADGGSTCSGAVCEKITQSNTDNHVYSIDCRGMPGRYVYVQLPGPVRVLNFMQFKAFGVDPA